MGSENSPKASLISASSSAEMLFSLASLDSRGLGALESLAATLRRFAGYKFEGQCQQVRSGCALVGIAREVSYHFVVAHCKIVRQTVPGGIKRRSWATEKFHDPGSGGVR